MVFIVDFLKLISFNFFFFKFQNSFFAMYLISCGTKLIDLSSSISNMAGYVHR